MPFFRKKPVVIEAKKYDGTMDGARSIMAWAHEGYPPEANAIIRVSDGPWLTIRTLEGMMTASAGDYIIKGVNGEFYPCKPDIFEKTYELVN